MALVLFCRQCHAGWIVVGEVPATCPTCQQVTTWTTEAPDPDRPYVLTARDTQWLQHIRIRSD